MEVGETWLVSICVALVEDDGEPDIGTEVVVDEAVRELAPPSTDDEPSEMVELEADWNLDVVGCSDTVGGVEDGGAESVGAVASGGALDALWSGAEKTEL